jgi:hypothetical protein
MIQDNFFCESRSEKFLSSIFTIYDTMVAQKVRDDTSRVERICSDVNTLFLLHKLLYHGHDDFT